MRYAILSDVHANAAALRAVLADAADMQAERILCLGDVLGYGPEPVAALELIHRSAHVCLAGNHDDAVAGRCGTEDFTDFAAAAVTRHRRALAQSALDWLRQLPHTCSYPDFACAHGDFSDPKNFNYVLAAEEAVPSWEAAPEQILFVGHTHEPALFVRGASGTPHALAPEDFVSEEGKRYLVNVGSVGYPRSGVCRSSYCLYDDVTKSVYFRSLPFDLEGYAAKMHGQGLAEAPWMQARAAARRRPAVRAEAAFAKPSASPSPRTESSPYVPPPALVVPAAASRPVARRVGMAGLGVAMIGLAAVLAGLWRSAGEKEPAEMSDQMPEATEMASRSPVEAPGTGYVCVRTEQCTIPSRTARVWFDVRLAKHSSPVALRLRFADARGEAVGNAFWVSHVKRSRRAPVSGIEVPQGAITAYLDVLAAEKTNLCEITECILLPHGQVR